MPSTLLWAKTIEDLHVNSIWQRLRNNLLLFLQILIVFLLMMVLLRPGRRDTGLVGDRFIFVLDASASSQATDESPSRFSRAQAELSALIDEMKSGDSAMLIQFSDRAQIVQNYTQQQRLIQQRLEELRPTYRRSDISEAMRVAAGLANPGSSRGEGDLLGSEALPATVYLASDGAVPPLPDFDLGNLTLRHVQIGKSDSENVGVTAFAADRNPDHPGQLELFARIENFGKAEVTTELQLRRTEAGATSGNELLIDAKEITIPSGGAVGEAFRLPDIRDGVFVLQLQINDDLSVDNTVYLAINPPQRARVLLVTEGNDPLETALITKQSQRLAKSRVVDPSFLKEQEYLNTAGSGLYDLIIYDRCQPQQLPLANTLFIGSMPPSEGWKQGDEKSLPVIVDVDRGHPLTQFLSFDDVVAFLHGRTVTGPEGSRALISGSNGELLVVAPREGYEDAVLGLPLFFEKSDGTVVPNTDWSRRGSFPVFVLNVLRYLGRVQFYSAAPNVGPGEAIRIRSESLENRLVITSPKGEKYPVERSNDRTFVFTHTDELGAYEVREPDKNRLIRRFTVNLYSSSESNIAPKAITVSDEAVSASRVIQARRIEYWKILLVLALLLLLLEWYIYNRRVWI